MTTNQQTIPTKEDVQQSPRDVILDAVITKTSVLTWRELLKDKPGAIEKIDEANRDKLIINIEYETAAGFQGSQAVTHYPKPSDRTKLGKLLMKYGSIQTGTSIKISFDGEGNQTILVDKK